MSVYYLVSITLQPGMRETLRSYEQHAARVMRHHGGEFVYVLTPTQPEQDEGPDEIHLLEFLAEEAFHAFRSDPELQQYVHLRSAAVKAASFLTLHAIPLADYLTPS